MPMTKKEHEKELRCYPAALTAAEVAEILRVSTKTVYKLIKDKSLPAVKVGRENRIAKSQLIDYLRQRERPGSNPKSIAVLAKHHLQQRERPGSNPKVCFLEKTPEKVWTCAVSCDIVRVGKNKKGVKANECHNHTCSQRTG